MSGLQQQNTDLVLGLVNPILEFSQMSNSSTLIDIVLLYLHI